MFSCASICDVTTWAPLNNWLEIMLIDGCDADEAIKWYESTSSVWKVIKNLLYEYGNCGGREDEMWKTKK